MEPHEVEPDGEEISQVFKQLAILEKQFEDSELDSCEWSPM